MKIRLALIAFALLAGLGHAQEMREFPPVFVVTEPAVRKSVSPTVLYSGTVISRDDAYLAGEVPGHLTWVADVGEHFKAGEPVARMDDVFIRQQVIEEQSIIESEKAKYEYHNPPGGAARQTPGGITNIAVEAGGMRPARTSRSAQQIFFQQKQRLQQPKSI